MEGTLEELRFNFAIGCVSQPMNHDVFNAACQRQLDSILASFNEALQDLSAKGHNPRRLHQLRIVIRRVDAALYLCKAGLNKSERRWFQRYGRRLREASNGVRDCDIVLKWLENQPSCEHLKKAFHERRDRARQQLGPLVAEIIGDDKVVEHSRQIHKPQLQQRAKVLASRLLKLNSRCMELAALAWQDARDRHRWRISCKKLRYALEFMADLGCGFDAQQPLAELKLLQEQLGEACDRITIARLILESHGELAQELAEVPIDWSGVLERFACGISGSLAAVRWCLDFESAVAQPD